MAHAAALALEIDAELARHAGIPLRSRGESRRPALPVQPVEGHRDQKIRHGQKMAFDTRETAANFRSCRNHDLSGSWPPDGLNHSRGNRVAGRRRRRVDGRVESQTEREADRQSEGGPLRRGGRHTGSRRALIEYDFGLRPVLPAFRKGRDVGGLAPALEREVQACVRGQQKAAAGSLHARIVQVAAESANGGSRREFARAVRHPQERERVGVQQERTVVGNRLQSAAHA